MKTAFLKGLGTIVGWILGTALGLAVALGVLFLIAAAIYLLIKGGDYQSALTATWQLLFKK